MHLLLLLMVLNGVKGLRKEMVVELQAATSKPSARPTQRPTQKPSSTYEPTYAPTTQPSDYPTYHPSSSPTDLPTLAPQLPAAKSQPPPPPPPVAIIVSVWVIFCACAGVGYFYYRRLQRKIAESDAEAGDYVVTDDAYARTEKGTTTFVEEDTQMNPLQFAGTSDTTRHDDVNRNFAAIGDDDEEFLADEDLL